MMKEIERKTVAIMGNGLSAVAATLLLADEYDVLRICEGNNQLKGIPFYPNDISSGIMGQYLEDIGLGYLKSAKKITNVVLFVNEKRLDLGNSFDEFGHILKSCYPEEEEKLNVFFDTVRKIGQEWTSFIENRFNSKAVKFVYSPKYMISLDKAFEKFQITNVDLQEILSAFLPVKDVAFAVYSGFLYTQFFDMNALECNIWEALNSMAEKSISEVVMVKDLGELMYHTEEEPFMEEAFKEEEELVLADILINFTNRKKQGDNVNENLSVYRGNMIDAEDVLNSHDFYLLRLAETGNVRIWNDSAFDLSVKDGNWQFELTCQADIPQNILIEQLEGQLQKYFDLSLSIEKGKIYGPAFYEKAFDANSGSGYCWAFNVKQSMKDPTNLIKKQKSTDFSCSYWGFAWLSAAYNVYNAVNNQMVHTGNELKIVRKKRKSNE